MVEVLNNLVIMESKKKQTQILLNRENKNWSDNDRSSVLHGESIIPLQ